jgi:hypothetical protein
MIVEIIEPDGLCHWKMQCEHGISECFDPEDHLGPHENERLCEELRRDTP